MSLRQHQVYVNGEKDRLKPSSALIVEAAQMSHEAVPDRRAVAARRKVRQDLGSRAFLGYLFVFGWPSTQNAVLKLSYRTLNLPSFPSATLCYPRFHQLSFALSTLPS